MRVIIIPLLLLISTVALTITAQTPQQTSEIRKLQKFYESWQFSEGYEYGQELSKKFPDSYYIRGWTLINGARVDSTTTVLEKAKQLIKDKGENRVTLLALTYAQVYQTPADAMATAEKLVKIIPNYEESIYAYNSALVQNKKYQESLNWLGKNSSVIRDKARLMTEQAVSTYKLEKAKKENGRVQSAFDIFDKNVKANPNSFLGNYYYAYYLDRERRYDEAVTYYKKAAMLAPSNVDLRELYWRAIKLQPRKNEQQKDAELRTAMNELLKQTENAPESVLAVWAKYKELIGWEATNPEDVKRKVSLERIIAEKYPASKYEEEIAFSNTQTVHGKYFGESDKAKYIELSNKKIEKRTAEERRYFADYAAKEMLFRAESIALERAYLKRITHFDKVKLGQISYDLLQRIGSRTDSTDDEVTNLIVITLENVKNDWRNLNTDIAAILLKRLTAQPASLIAKDAEKYARSGVLDADKKAATLPKDAKTNEILELRLHPLNTLAGALIANGQLDEAEKLLNEISELIAANNSQNSMMRDAAASFDLNRAELFTARKDWEQAENFYVKSNDDTEAARKTFEKFYQNRFGKTDGFDSYYSEIKKRLKGRAKERIAKSKITNPLDAVPFTLKAIDGKSISLVDFKGKIIVINFWGTWCGPCVAEMTELQEFADKYRVDEDIVILTIDHGDGVEDVKKFMTDRKYSLPVLMSDGYIEKIPQFGRGEGGEFPTTLFIDKSGKVSFVKTGNSGNLVEEFSWRVDILKES